MTDTAKPMYVAKMMTPEADRMMRQFRSRAVHLPGGKSIFVLTEQDMDYIELHWAPFSHFIGHSGQSISKDDAEANEMFLKQLAKREDGR